MSISSDATRKAGPFTGNGVTVTFPFTFKVFQASDLLVVRLDTASGVETTLVLTTDYTVTLNANQDSNPGGTVTAVVAPTSMQTLTIGSAVPQTQSVVLTNNGGFYPTVLNDFFDKAIILIQQLSEKILRSVTLPFSAPAGVSGALPMPTANKLIGWNPSANALQNVDPATIATAIAYGTTAVDLFSGNGATTAFTLSNNPGAQNNLEVTIGGVRQRPGLDYTWLSGTLLTFTSAPPAGTNNILVKYSLALAQGVGDAASTAYLPSGAGAVTTNLQAKERERESPEDRGAVGNATTDDTAALIAALAAAAGGVLTLTPKKNYKITSAITIPANTKVWGFGATITSTVAGAASIILSANSHIIGAKIVGPSVASYVADEVGIAVSGASAASYLATASVMYCDISQFGAYGIYSTFASDVKVANNRIHNCGYSGCTGLSAANWVVENNIIHDMTPGTAGNAYGISLSRIATSDSEVTYPRSHDCSITGNMVYNIPLWSAIDTHSGNNITITGNTVQNCKNGVVAVPCGSVASPGQEVLAPKNITITGNSINCVSGGAAIYAVGAAGAAVGTPNEYATSITICGNTTYGGGISGDATGASGAIFSRTVKNLIISGNSIREPWGNGVFLYYDVQGMAITGNVIQDPNDSANTIPCAVRAESGNVTGVISGNSFIRNNAALNTYVAVRGIYQNITTGNAITLGDNYNTFTTPLSAISEWVSYTPTITSGTGAFTSVSATGKYRKQNNTVWFEVHITITTNGTAATSIIASLPSTSQIARAHSGASPSTAKALVAYTVATGTTVNIRSYDATYPGADGYQFYISGYYNEA